MPILIWRALDWSPAQALSHFFHHGLQERRVAPLTLNPEALVALAGLPIRDDGFRARLLTNLGGPPVRHHRSA